MGKLVIVTRRDLPIAVQATQALHAAVQFALDHEPEGRLWAQESNTVVVAAATDELELQRLVVRALDFGLKVTEFHEPDLERQLTAIALEPSAVSERLVRQLPLAFAAG